MPTAVGMSGVHEASAMWVWTLKRPCPWARCPGAGLWWMALIHRLPLSPRRPLHPEPERRRPLPSEPETRCPLHPEAERRRPLPPELERRCLLPPEPERRRPLPSEPERRRPLPPELERRRPLPSEPETRCLLPLCPTLTDAPATGRCASGGRVELLSGGCLPSGGKPLSRG